MISSYIFPDIPDSKDPLIVRTYFDNNKEWKSISEKLTKSYEMGFRAYVDFLDDKKYHNCSSDEIVKLCKSKYKHTFIFVADSLTFSNSENSVLCIDLYDQPGKSFRVIPSQLSGIENNLSIANMDFYEFYDNCDSDGVFRGFK